LPKWRQRTRFTLKGSDGGWQKNGRRCGRPLAIPTAQALSELIEAFFGLGRRRAVPRLRWQDVPPLAVGLAVQKLPEAELAAPRLAEELDVRKPLEVALAAPRLAEDPDVRKPPEVAPAAELLPEERSGATGVSQRNPEVG